MNNRPILCISLSKVEKSFSSSIKKLGIRTTDYFIYPTPPENNNIKSKVGIILQELRSLFRLSLIINRFRSKDIYITGGYYSLLLLNRLLPCIFKNSHIFIYNFYLHSLGENKTVEKAIRFLFDKANCTLIIQTPYEMDKYSRMLKKANVRFVPYCSDVRTVPDGKSGDYIFTGGYTNRDYTLMIRLAERFPDQKFIFIASRLNDDLRNVAIPANVTVFYDVDASVFEKYLSEAKLVVIPLKENVGASGQMLCLQAMRNRKPIIYTDVSSINYYFNGDAGLPYRIGDLDSLSENLTAALHSATDLEKMAEKAYRNSLDYTFDAGNKLLIDIIRSEPRL